jgi:hypothetical protein
MTTKTNNYEGRLYLHDGGECYCYEHGPMSLQSAVQEKRKFNGAARDIWTPCGGWSDMSVEFAQQMDEEFTSEFKTECETCAKVNA